MDVYESFINHLKADFVFIIQLILQLDYGDL
jgi:hypothetical protein